MVYIRLRSTFSLQLDYGSDGGSRTSSSRVIVKTNKQKNYLWNSSILSNGSHCWILIQHLILTTILWEKYYYLNFTEYKREAWRNYTFYPKDTSSWKDKVLTQDSKTGFFFFFFYKRPDGKYFWLCGSYGLCCNYSSLQLLSPKQP